MTSMLAGCHLLDMDHVPVDITDVQIRLCCRSRQAVEWEVIQRISAAATERRAGAVGVSSVWPQYDANRSDLNLSPCLLASLSLTDKTPSKWLGYAP